MHIVADLATLVAINIAINTVALVATIAVPVGLLAAIAGMLKWVAADTPLPGELVPTFTVSCTPYASRLFLEAAGAWRQQGQRGSTRTRPAVRRRRMLAIECGTCRSGRTGTARPETLG